MKALARVRNLYIESGNETTDLMIVDGEHALETYLSPIDTIDLINLLKAHLATLVLAKSCRICQNYDEHKICAKCHAQDQFTPITY